MKRRHFLLISGSAACAAIAVFAQGRPPRMRVHTVIEAQKLSLQFAWKKMTGSQVSIATKGG